MVEPLFMSAAPSWAGFQSPGLGWPQTPFAFANRGMGPGAVAFGSPLNPMTGIATGPRGPQGFNTLHTDPYGYGSVPAGFAQPLVTGFSTGLPGVPNLFGVPGAIPGFQSPDVGGISTVQGLLMAVAARRGQPMGPTNDQELEDFLYDALELLPGTTDVEVRCEGGRVTFTGTVLQKRLKRDVGEIAWAIQSVTDVQNNVTISTRRRSRAGREAELHTTASGRKQG